MGRLIVIEGLDGSGKGTQAALLAETLTQRGIPVREVSFPDYESEGSALVRYYLGGGLGNDPEGVNPYAASMFFAADRYISYRNCWKDFIAGDSAVVIANRYTTANAYHQLAKLPRERWEDFLSWLWDFEFGKLGLPKPDTVISLILQPHLSQALIRKRCAETGVKMDIHEADEEYLRHCYDALCFVTERMGWVRLDCADGDKLYSVEEMHEKILRSLGL